MRLIDDLLARILVCPVDQADLTEDVDDSALVCSECGRRYPVENGIPMMIAQEQKRPEDA